MITFELKSYLIEEWINERGRIHREGDKPAYTRWYENRMKLKEYYAQRGFGYRENKAYYTKWDSKGNIIAKIA